jgi:hypothetical protein
MRHVVVVLARPVERGARDVHRFLRRIRGEELDLEVLRQARELVDGRRAVDVGRDQQHLLLRGVADEACELARARGLARALQAREQDDRRRLRGEVEALARPAHQLHQLLVHDAHQRLARREAADHLLAERLVLDARDEVLDHRETGVRIEEGEAHFAQHLLDVVLGEARVAAQGLDDVGEALREGV